MKSIFWSLALSVLISGCGSDDSSDITSTGGSYEGTLGQLKSAATAVSSAGGEFDISASASMHGLLDSKALKISSGEEESSSISYCSNKGGPWDSANSEQAQSDDANYAVHAIECLARVDETTETPVGFLSQIAFIGCILEEAGADLDVDSSQTFSDITVNPSTASTRCNDLTNTNIKEDTTDYTFNVSVSVSPTGWDRKIELLVGTNPFYTILVSEANGKLSIKASEYEGSNIGGTFDININQTTGALIFESTSTKNMGHARLRLEGTISSDWEFTDITNIEGITIICNSNGCNQTGTSGGYSGATVNGALNDLSYEAITVSGAVCSEGASGCSATTGTDCSGASSCLAFSGHVDHDFADDENFSTDMSDFTSGPICFSSVLVTTAPTRSSLSNCTL